MAIKNMTEEFVKIKLEENLEAYGCCKCEMCVDDMKAMALNNLPPHYVNTVKGELITKAISMALQNNTDLNVAVIKAIESVASKPRCGAKPYISG